MKLDDIFSLDLLEEMLGKKYVREQQHPGLSFLRILNYTESAMFDNVWNEVTMQCRGLIYDYETGNVIARPFPKFFNYGDPKAGELPQDEPCIVTNKLDGSLGILYYVDNVPAIATRGSFTSDQAIHATKLFRERYSDFSESRRLTFLFEIIYKENRIVLDYGDQDDLVLLGAVDIETGESISPAFIPWWKGPKAEVFEAYSLRKALEMPPRENAEGVVVHFLGSDKRVKIKQADYCALHAIITKTNARVLWQYLAVNACKHLVGAKITKPSHWGSYIGVDSDQAQKIMATGDEWRDKLLGGVPDEFYEWVSTTLEDLQWKADALDGHVRNTAFFLADNHQTRKTQAEWLSTQSGISKEEKGLIFLLLNDPATDLSTAIWKQLKPAHETPFMNRSEDVA